MSPPRPTRRRREAIRAEIARRKAEKRRRRRWLLALLLLLLLFLRECSCAPTPPAVGPAPAPLPVPTVATPTVSPPPTPARVPRRTRPRFRLDAPAALPWLAPFQLQVAARGPRLAECFSGAPHPGTLTWTAAVDPATGLVSDHHLEPTLASDDLTADQRDCLLGVLSTPPYRLDASGSPATPARISMGIEF